MFNTQITTSAKVTTSRKAISYQRKRICVMQVWAPGLSRPRQSAAAASSSLIFNAEINNGTRIWTIVSEGLVTMFLKLNSIPRIFMAVFDGAPFLADRWETTKNHGCCDNGALEEYCTSTWQPQMR